MTKAEEPISESKLTLEEEIQYIKEQNHLLIKILGELNLAGLNERSKKHLKIMFNKLRKIDNKIYESKRKKQGENETE